MSPQARALRRLAVKAEATERGKQPGGARTSRHILIIGRHGLAPRFPNYLPARERSLTMVRRESERGKASTCLLPLWGEEWWPKARKSQRFGFSNDERPEP
ncbi:hypothetical protein GCM10010837_01310 [Aminobacter niigataensis]